MNILLFIACQVVFSIAAPQTPASVYGPPGTSGHNFLGAGAPAPVLITGPVPAPAPAVIQYPAPHYPSQYLASAPAPAIVQYPASYYPSQNPASAPAPVPLTSGGELLSNSAPAPLQYPSAAPSPYNFAAPAPHTAYSAPAPLTSGGDLLSGSAPAPGAAPLQYPSAAPSPYNFAAPAPHTAYTAPAPAPLSSGGDILSGSAPSPAGTPVLPGTAPGELVLPQNTRLEIRDEKGQYSHGFSDNQGTQVSEQGTLITTNGGWEYVIAKRGAYSYISPEGLKISVKYIADDQGYKELERKIE